MSQVKIQGNASGTGIFTIASPNSNSNQTLTLPDSTGTVLTKSGTYVATSDLGSGTANSSTYLRGDQTWAAVSGFSGPNGQVFTSSGTFTVPAGITTVKVIVVGGGGGGGSSSSGFGAAAGGGGGGGVTIEYITGLTPGGTVTVTVGSGGGATAAGGTSSFGAYCSATGGSAGANRTTTGGGAGGAGGAGSGGSIDITGGAGAPGAGAVWTGTCGNVWLAVSGAGSGFTAAAGPIAAGNNQFSFSYAGVSGTGYLGGFGGTPRSGNGNGNAATGYGCGGSGACNQDASASRTGGAGSGGIVVVEY